MLRGKHGVVLMLAVPLQVLTAVQPRQQTQPQQSSWMLSSPAMLPQMMAMAHLLAANSQQQQQQQQQFPPPLALQQQHAAQHQLYWPAPAQPRLDYAPLDGLQHVRPQPCLSATATASESAAAAQALPLAADYSDQLMALLAAGQAVDGAFSEEVYSLELSEVLLLPSLCHHLCARA